MPLKPIEAEQARTENLSEGERDFFRRFPFLPCLTSPDAWHMPLISLHDYVLALTQLSLQPNDLVLDFGCGPGWVSELLARHGLRVVGIDVAEGALRGCRERMAAAGVTNRTDFIRGDVQRYPFRDGSFQAVICIAALHHIEDMGQAVAEISRILKPDGEAILIEPGEDHSQKEHSRQAIEEHGTLEQDVLPSDVYRWASEAGFAEFFVVPQYFAFPAMRWNWTHWEQHCEMAHSRRPERSAGRLRRLWHLLKIWWGARGWRDAAKQQFPAEWLFHLHFDQWMRDHCCYLLRKSRGDRTMGSTWPEGCEGTIEPLGVRLEGDRVLLHLRVKNTGRAAWLARTWGEFGQVRVGLKRLDSPGGTVIETDYLRFDLPHDLPSGAEREWELRSMGPAAELPAVAAVDLVSEQIKWFQCQRPDGGAPEVRLEHGVDGPPS
jgi:ubiquinone/menaquinone biosynthesis C-methylase UbiE